MAIDTVVFVPGICGSVLMHGGETVWPGTPWNVAFKSYPDEYVQLLATSPDLRATDVLRSVSLTVLGIDLHHFDGYQRALDALEGMKFRENGGTLIPFAYDWRRDIRVSAESLKTRLAAPELAGRRVAIVAHSMGGLVSRYMLEKLGPPAGVRIELCVLVAVPHLGAPVALQNILGLRPEIFLTGAQCKVALRSTDYPSAYQLLPRLGVPALLEASAATGFEQRDPYQADVAQHLGLVAGSLAAAHALGASLDPIGPGFKPPCRYVAIAGNAQKTVTANYLDLKAGAQPVEEATAGDGTVPLWSSAPPGIPVRYVAAAHGSMFSDTDVVAMLQAVLRPGTPGGRLFNLEPSVIAPELSVQPLAPSVEAGQTLTVAIVADRPAARIDAVLHVEHLFADRKEAQDVPIHYEGGLLRSLSIDLTAPAEAAVMRINVAATGRAVSGDTTVLVLPR